MRFLWRARCWVLRDRAGLRGSFGTSGPRHVTPWWAGREGYRPYFENYTVDASILDSELCRLRRAESGSQQRFTCAFGCTRSLVNLRSSSVAAIDSYSCGQVSKSKRWMPWHLEPKKDVVICDKPRGADKRALIRGSPNGETPSGAAM